MSLQEIKFLAHVSGQSQVRLPNTLGWNDGRLARIILEHRPDHCTIKVQNIIDIYACPFQ